MSIETKNSFEPLKNPSLDKIDPEQLSQLLNKELLIDKPTRKDIINGFLEKSFNHEFYSIQELPSKSKNGEKIQILFKGREVGVIENQNGDITETNMYDFFDKKSIAVSNHNITFSNIQQILEKKYQKQQEIDKLKPQKDLYDKLYSGEGERTPESNEKRKKNFEKRQTNLTAYIQKILGSNFSVGPAVVESKKGGMEQFSVYFKGPQREPQHVGFFNGGDEGDILATEKDIMETIIHTFIMPVNTDSVDMIDRYKKLTKENLNAFTDHLFEFGKKNIGTYYDDYHEVYKEALNHFWTNEIENNKAKNLIKFLDSKDPMDFFDQNIKIKPITN